MYTREEHGTSPESTAHHDSDPCPKKSRRSVQKRVVSLPALDAEVPRLKAGGEAAPPPDSWAWRKYGQKPIKGSPYPRGYYRCSSSKGCPARKQVERSRADPTMFVVTYSSDHNHPWPPVSKNHHHHGQHQNPSHRAAEHQPTPDKTSAAAEAASETEEKFADLITEVPTSLLMSDDFRWPSNSDDGLLYGPLFGGAPVFDESYKFGSSRGGLAVDEDEEALFAGLGELPECSVIFQRGFLDRQMRGGEDGKRCRLEMEDVAVATAGAAATWCGSTG
ncbi:putative WRKY transcription factor 69 [Platanthera guangdongensis]|uniref:WRKY transcription factor 69 n=1 Tax=Platanthera guangdongensis TaxID=2320717 RepID=A0ABR2M2W0_9ASPA